VRSLAKFSLSLSLVAFGCGRSEPAPRETPEQAAARVLDLAQNLEKEHKSKEAFAAYHQIVRHYPATAGSKKAAERIAAAQKAARLRKQK
jgi:TolA-binding protein